MTIIEQLADIIAELAPVYENEDSFEVLPEIDDGIQEAFNEIFNDR